MPATRLSTFDYSDRDHVYFVTLRARAGTRPFVDDALCADVIASLKWLRERHVVVVYAYCLMPDHLHLLVSLSAEATTLGNAIQRFKQFTSRRAQRIGLKGSLWQDKYYDHIVRRSEDGMAIAAYIRDNPVRAGLVDDAEVYRWSGRWDPM